jgi:hypothetical protein
MSKHGGLGSEWHRAVFSASSYICEAETHAPGCDGFPTEAHHIVYRSHLTKPALWIVENGIALSQACHILAHASHNANVSQPRLDRAVAAVNAIQGDDRRFRIQPFWRKGHV